MELTAENVTRLLGAIGIEAEVEVVEVDDAVAKAEELAARPEETETDDRSLEDRAKDEGKVVVSVDEYAETKREAKAGAKAAKQLHEDRFERAHQDAVDGLRLDATPETKERFQKLYDQDDDGTLEVLENLPKIASDKPRGSAEGANDETPEGVDAERHDLDKRVRAHMKEHNVRDYKKALDAVVAEDAEEDQD